ncbi:hypothetical protein GJ496_002452 [Pomphorhynchus laevis]|nr:hypothetical protein GJ496_002452 [Pomphorhynchus laevis]
MPNFPISPKKRVRWCFPLVSYDIHSSQTVVLTKRSTRIAGDKYYNASLNQSRNSMKSIDVVHNVITGSCFPTPLKLKIRKLKKVQKPLKPKIYTCPKKATSIKFKLVYNAQILIKRLRFIISQLSEKSIESLADDKICSPLSLIKLYGHSPNKFALILMHRYHIFYYPLVEQIVRLIKSITDCKYSRIKSASG